jgi:hypothetical protein
VVIFLRYPTDLRFTDKTGPLTHTKPKVYAPGSTLKASPFCAKITTTLVTRN